MRATFLILFLILFSMSVVAQDEPKVKTIDIKGDDGEHIVLLITEGKGLVATDAITGEVVGEVDFEELEATIGTAVGSVSDALEELKEMQITIEVGNNNELKISKEDEEIVIDVDTIIAGVGAALESLGDIDAIKHIYTEQISAEELDSEIDKLRQEVRELREELAKEQNKED
jgi:hypothetical protein